MQPFLAMITPLGQSGGGGGGPVDPGYSPPWAQVPPGQVPQPPLGIWGPGDPRPTNPIAGWNPGTGTFPPSGPPLGTWGGGNVPFPTPPIYIPIQPPPADGGEIDNTLPPVYVPVYPPFDAARIKAAIEFWTGNLPPIDTGNTPTPV